MVVVCLPVWAGWDVVMLAVCVLPVRGLFARRRAAVASRGAEGLALCGRGVVAATGCLPRPEGLLCSGGGVNEWRVRECGAGGERLPWPRGPCLNPGGVEVAVREVLRGAVGVARGEGGGVGGGPGHLCDESVVSRRFVPGVACRCVGGGAVAGLGISSAFGFASRLLKLLSVAGFSPCGGHRMYCGATERCWFSSRRFSSLFHRVRPRVPWGCRGAPLWCSPLPFRSVIEGLDRGVFSELGLSTPINYGAKVLVKLLIVQMKTCFSSFGGRFLTFETENAPIFGLRRGENGVFSHRPARRISLKT